ncbi:MAG TPA: hypothetical protein GXX53_06495 [Tissierellia bacterium]|nr:hypothetical protein [Tissierellia bacterium]
MFYQKKLDRAMKWLKEKSNSQSNINSTDEMLGYSSENIELEKKDILAIIISAFLIFGPIFLVLIIIYLLVFRL